MVMLVGVVMIMVMAVLVKRQCAPGLGPEQRPVFGCRRHRHRRALATDMPVQAHHPVGRPHHHHQVVARSQGSTHVVTDRSDEHSDQTIPRAEGNRIAKLQERLRRLLL